MRFFCENAIRKNGAKLRFHKCIKVSCVGTGAFDGRRRSLLFVGKLIFQFDKFLYLIEEGVDVLELAVH